MNEPSNAPMLPPTSGVSEWFTVWREALTRPSEQTFARIAQSPGVKLSTALLWVFLGSLINAFLASSILSNRLNQVLQNSDLGVGGFPESAGGVLVSVICGAPVAALLTVILFALGVGIFQLIARMFGGQGTYEQLAYTLAAIVTPVFVVSGLLTLLSLIPFVGFCFRILGFAAALYALVLEIMAVKSVNQFGWGPAIGTVLLPAFLFGCCIAVGVAGIVSMLGPDIMESFEMFITPAPIP